MVDLSSPLVEGQKNLDLLKSELEKMCVGSDILITKEDMPTYDLATLVDLSCVNQYEAYDAFCKVFMNNLANYIAISDEGGNSPAERLEIALSSSIWPNCSRILRGGSNTAYEILHSILYSVNDEAQMEAMNKIMFEFLTNNTISAPYNSYGRLLLVCPRH